MDIKERQRALRTTYASDPSAALLTLSVRSAASDLTDPLHCAVAPDSAGSGVLRSGAHPAVGGEGDAPCSADLLLSALAACQEVTLRMVTSSHSVGFKVQLGEFWNVTCGSRLKPLRDL